MVFEVALTCCRTYTNPAEIMLYMGFTIEMEVFGVLSIVCEFKILTLFLHPFLDQGIQFVGIVAKGISVLKQNCLQSIIYTL
jgi:hypothetical protein